MTIPVEQTRQEGTGDGANLVFGFPSQWDLKNVDHLRVIKVVSGVETLMVRGADYSVSLLASTITFTVAPAAGATVVIRIYPPYKQEGDLRSRTEINLGAHEDLHDARQRQILRLADEATRSVRVPEGEAGSDTLTLLPTLDERRGTILGFDDDGLMIPRTTANAAEVLWDLAGQIAAGLVSRRYKVTRDITWKKLDANAITAGTGGSTTYRMYLNGAVVATVVVATGQRYGSTDISIATVAGDEVWFDVSAISPTTPPSDVIVGMRT